MEYLVYCSIPLLWNMWCSMILLWGQCAEANSLEALSVQCKSNGVECM